jgi:hypothetical protein
MYGLIIINLEFIKILIYIYIYSLYFVFIFIYIDINKCFIVIKINGR